MKLFDFAYCGNYKQNLEKLAKLSPEKWDFGTSKENSILKCYIEHTFMRLHSENKVYESENYAIFNTGLFDGFYQPIYAFFKPNEKNWRQRWFLDGFYSEYQLSSTGVSEFPERANYFDDPAELVFDTHLEIVPQYEHIFGDQENIKRLPENIRDNPAMRTQIFDGALKMAKRMLESNYKTAIPQFYKGKIQLLVPICLRDGKTPDLALTCVKSDDKSKYLGRTCLTLEMAYNNARLIAKPDSNWLQP